MTLIDKARSDLVALNGCSTLTDALHHRRALLIAFVAQHEALEKMANDCPCDNDGRGCPCEDDAKAALALATKEIE